MLLQLYAVARNAFVESIRQPFYVICLATVGFLLILNPFLSAYTFEDDNKLATDMGLSMLLVGSLVMSAFIASGVVSREIENKTVLTVITKPLPRPVFVLGKYFGVAGALTLAWWVWSLLHLLSLRQGAFSTAGTPYDFPVIVFGGAALIISTGVALAANYFMGRHFGAWFSRVLAISLPIAVVLTLPFSHDFETRNPMAGIAWAEYLAVSFILQSTLLFSAIAVAASTRLGQVATLSVMLVVFLLGLTSDYAFGRNAESHTVTITEATGATREVTEPAEFWATAAYSLVPNIQFHWLSDAITQDTIVNITPGYVAMVTGYTLILIVGTLGLAVALFQTRRAT